MTNTELIRQEIERRIGAMYNLSSGYSALNTCRELLNFIDSLPKETVTDCRQLEEELDAFIKSGKAIKEENCGTYTITYIDPLKVARHFAKWGAEHLIAANKMIGDHIADDSKKVELRNNSATTSQELDEAAAECQRKLYDGYYSGHIEAYQKAFKAGANWQKEQDHDACYQCEKNYDNVFYRGEQHAIKMMKEAAIEIIVTEGANGHPFIPALDLYDSDIATVRKGDKVLVAVFTDRKKK